MSGTVSLTEFMQRNPPAAHRRRSQLEPFAEDLKTLQKQGYALVDMQAYLEANKIKVSRAGISAFLVKLRRSTENQLQHAS
jgi:hypothetical protein